MKLSQLKEGDKFSCEFVVTSKTDSCVSVKRIDGETKEPAKNSNDFYYVESNTVITFISRPIQVGDFLNIGVRKNGKVLSIHEGWAWIQWPNISGPTTTYLADRYQ